MTYLLVVLASCAYARVLLAKKQQEQDFLFFHLHATVFVAVFEQDACCADRHLLPCSNRTLVALIDTRGAVAVFAVRAVAARTVTLL